MVLNELDLSSELRVAGANVDMTHDIEHAIKQAVAAQFWKWYAAHDDDSVAHLNLLFIHKTIRVHDLRPVFVMLFGDAPA